jgi:hypothetical protein
MHADSNPPLPPWRKERGKDRWTTPDGWVIEGNNRDGYSSLNPEGRTKVFWSNSLASAKRLTDTARQARTESGGES